MLRYSRDAIETFVKVIPVQAGIQGVGAIFWIPACAGMTETNVSGRAGSSSFNLQYSACTKAEVQNFILVGA